MSDQPFREVNAQGAYLDFNPLTDRRERDFTTPKPRLLDRLRGFAALPTTGIVKGFDLSRYNDTPDFKLAWADGYRWCSIQATYVATDGKLYPDYKFEQHWKAATLGGFPIMPYHFYRGTVDGGKQAEFFANALTLPSLAADTHWLPLGIDVETSDGVTLAVRQARYSALVTALLNRSWNVSTYSSPALWLSLMGGIAIHGYGWDAHWTSAAAPAIPKGWTQQQTKFWQIGVARKHSWVPVPTWYPKALDIDYFLGTEQELRALAGYAPEPTLAERVDRLEAWAKTQGMP